MGLEYPKIPAEDVVMREQFINNQYVADNGGTIVGALDFLGVRGAIFDGTNDYIDYGLRSDLDFKSGNFSIEVVAVINSLVAAQVLVTKGAVGVDGGYSIYLETDGEITFQIEQFDGTTFRVVTNSTPVTAGLLSGIVCTVDRTSATGLKVFAGGVECTYSIQDDPTPAGDVASEDYPFRIGARANGSFKANATFFDTNVYNRSLTSEEVLDRATIQTFQEVKPENTIGWLPLRTSYNDGSNQVTPNLGILDDANVHLGDGSTSTTYPTLLENNGASFDGGDYIEFVTALDYSAGFSFFCLFNVDDLAADRTLLAGTFNASSMVNIQVDTTGILQSAFYNGSALFGASSTVAGSGWHSVGFVKNAAENSPTMYLDGVLQTGTTIAAINGAVGMYLGQRTDGSDKLVGDMKFPIVTTQEFTETQVKWLHDYSFSNFNK